MNPETEIRGNVVVVFGSTGTAGTGAINACLGEASIAEVRAVTRRALAESHLGLSSVDLGRAMLRVGLDGTWRGSRTLAHRDLLSIGGATAVS